MTEFLPLKTTEKVLVRRPGVARCCLATIMARDDNDKEGATMKCKTCGDLLAFRAGAWQWAGRIVR
jgi:hypothetical protein